MTDQTIKKDIESIIKKLDYLDSLYDILNIMIIRKSINDKLRLDIMTIKCEYLDNGSFKFPRDKKI